MDKISKFLRKLSIKERERLTQIIMLILSDTFETLDVKKLRGSINLYRVRARNIRIIFKKEKEENVLIDIGFRKDVYEKI